jgi:hypothetical protein
VIDSVNAVEMMSRAVRTFSSRFTPSTMCSYSTSEVWDGGTGDGDFCSVD